MATVQPLSAELGHCWTPSAQKQSPVPPLSAQTVRRIRHCRHRQSTESLSAPSLSITVQRSHFRHRLREVLTVLGKIRRCPSEHFVKTSAAVHFSGPSHSVSTQPAGRRAPRPPRDSPRAASPWSPAARQWGPGAGWSGSRITAPWLFRCAFSSWLAVTSASLLCFSILMSSSSFSLSRTRSMYFCCMPRVSWT